MLMEKVLDTLQIPIYACFTDNRRDFRCTYHIKHSILAMPDPKNIPPLESCPPQQEWEKCGVRSYALPYLTSPAVNNEYSI